MASLEDLEDLERESQDRQDKKDKKSTPDADGDAKMDVDGEKDENEIDPEILSLATLDIVTRRRLLENDLRVMRQEHQRLTHEKSSMKERIKDNLEKIENNRFVRYNGGLLGHRTWGFYLLVYPDLHRTLKVNIIFFISQAATLPRWECCRALGHGPDR